MLTTNLGGPGQRRAHLRERANVRFVDRARFLELLVSTHRLERCDDLGAGLRGLHDPEQGVTFVIAEAEMRRGAGDGVARRTAGQSVG